MEALTDSIRENGIMTPLLVRPINSGRGEYEIISGHRRAHTAEKAGLDTVPAFVVELNRAEAVSTLREYEYNPEIMRLTVMGGGACILKHFWDGNDKRVQYTYGSVVWLQAWRGDRYALGLYRH